MPRKQPPTPTPEQIEAACNLREGLDAYLDHSTANAYVMQTAVAANAEHDLLTAAESDELAQALIDVRLRHAAIIEKIQRALTRRIAKMEKDVAAARAKEARKKKRAPIRGIHLRER